MQIQSAEGCNNWAIEGIRDSNNTGRKCWMGYKVLWKAISGPSPHSDHRGQMFAEEHDHLCRKACKL